MKLYFLKEEALETLRGNVPTNYRKYSMPTNEWIDEYFEGQSPFLEYKKEVKPFTLDTSIEKPSESDVANVKILYTALKDLTETEATDERLWSGLAHGQLWYYQRYRWSLDTKILKENEIHNRYFFGQTKRRSLFTNPISRLWWIGRLTYDSSRKNPFELTEFLSNDFSTRSLMLFSSNFTSNSLIVRAFLSAMIELESEGMPIDRDIFSEAIRFLNILGGTYILDYFEENELKEKIKISVFSSHLNSI